MALQSSGLLDRPAAGTASEGLPPIRLPNSYREYSAVKAVPSGKRKPSCAPAIVPAELTAWRWLRFGLFKTRLASGLP